MSAPALPSPDTPAASRTPWRLLGLLTLGVAAVHLLLLALAPTGMGTDATLPLANRFSTRTIVIAPPAPAATPAPPPKAARPPALHPERPPASMPKEPETPVERAQPAIDSIAPDAPVVSAAPAAEAPAAVAPAGEAADQGAAANGPPGNDAGGGTGTQAGTGNGPGTPGATQELVVPGSITLSFAVTAQQGAQPLSGAFGELTWLQDGNQYNARLSMKLLFKTLRQWTSTGTIGASGIAPDRYSDTRRTEVASHFARDRGEIVFSNNSPSVPLLAGAQDRLSVMMQLGAMLAGAPERYPPGTQIALQTVTASDAGVWTFTVGDEEMLDLPAGQVWAVRLSRPPRKALDLQVDLWLSPGHNYLPARLKLTEANGDFADFQVREFPQPPGRRPLPPP